MWFSLIDPKVKVGQKLRKLSIINHVLAIWGWLLEKLLCSLLVWHSRKLSSFLQIWLKAGWLPGLLIERRGVSWAGGCRLGVRALFLYVICLYIQSFMILEPQIYSCLPNEWYFIVCNSLFIHSLADLHSSFLPSWTMLQLKFMSACRRNTFIQWFILWFSCCISAFCLGVREKWWLFITRVSCWSNLKSHCFFLTPKRKADIQKESQYMKHWIKVFLLQATFPGGPVVKNRGYGFKPWLENQDPTCSGAAESACLS